jgi:spore coat polysaccharide biosynthesis protein SpsF
MSGIKHVVIGIQARSSSRRFPRKVYELIDGKPMLRHVIDAADKASFYLNRYTYQSKIRVSYAVLCPYKDEIIKSFGSRAMVIEGPEDDVLTRYKIMADRLQADYIVRITSDCPLLPPFLITKHIKIASANQYDYCSNVDPKVRTAIDGYDVEVMSKRALDWADQNASDPTHREHVTSILRTNQIPSEFKTGHILGFLNQSHIKLSVDTPDDLEHVRIEHERTKSAHEKAEALSGSQNVHKV